MNPKISSEHLNRTAVVYVRQSTPGQVTDNTESQLRQYALVDSARATGFANVVVIDDDLGRSGSGLVERPGFQKRVAMVCGGAIGAVYCIEASRLARNGRDWHHLINLCALVDTLVIDPDGTYDPRLDNDRLLLGLKGSMSEYELSLLRQRGLAARDSKAKRGELQVALPPGYCWDELGRIVMDPDERVADAIRLVFSKFRELGSARQVLLWARPAAVKMPVLQQRAGAEHVKWQSPAYHQALAVLKHPIYAGAYVFGRRGNRTRVVEGRARKTSGHHKPMNPWNVLLRDHRAGCISWDEFEEHQKMIEENAHMQKRASRKSGHGGRALLTALVRCGRCGRMMRVFYGMRSGHAHRYQCRGDDKHVGAGLCIGIGGVRVDRAVADLILEAVSNHAVDAAIKAVELSTQEDESVKLAVQRELEQARYEAGLAARRYEAVDPAKRLVARELEARWNNALEQVQHIEGRLVELDAASANRPRIDRDALMALAHDLPSAWNAPGADARTKQRLTQILVHEVVIDLDDAANEAVVTVHWHGGRHSEARVARTSIGRYPADRHPGAVQAMRRRGGQWPDREVAVTMNRMRCKSAQGETWTTVRVRELRERLGIAAFNPDESTRKTISVDETAHRLKICLGSVHRLIRSGAPPATQLMPSAPWQVPVEALDAEAVAIGVRDIIERRPRKIIDLPDEMTLSLPGF